MSLCNLCQSIPWESLPSVPEDLPSELSGFPYVQIVLEWPKGERGHPHHQSLETLRKSASQCDLCRLICGSAENVQKNMEELKPKWEAGEMGRGYAWPSFETWLVKRRDGGDGCWVMSFVREDEKKRYNKPESKVEEAWIIAALGLCTKPGDPLESMIQGRPVEESGDTPIAIERACKWLKECDEHPTCPSGKTELPSRVIDVGEGIDGPEVHLREIAPEEVVEKYISLSYCWGESPEFTTTKSTIEDRKRGILIVDMPKTYRDIVKLSRELGVRYVWIDSLCICQDDHENWERESAKMLSIYSNSYLTVAASRAEKKIDGFLGERPTREYVPLKYTRNGVHGSAMAFGLPLREELIKHDYLTMPNEPLSKRAWGVQERMLSKRMLHYGSGQTFYECNEGFRGEDGLTLTERYDSVHKTLKHDPDRLHKMLQERGAKPNTRPNLDILRGWYDLLWQYGPKKLSRASDKLPAVSGLAGIFAKYIEGEYLAGLWRNHLIEGLLWQGLSFRRVSEYRAPSWSWASGDGVPGTGLHVDYDELAEVLEAGVKLKGANPYGEVTDGWIKLRAPMEELFLILDNWDPEGPGHTKYQNNVKVRTQDGNPEGEISRFDFAFTADDAPREAKKIVDSLKGVRIFALVLIKSCSWTPDSDDASSYHSLIVREVEGATGKYQRLGFIIGEKDMFGYKPEDLLKEKSSEITLV